MIGSPIGFARKVGSGVKSFFYEPYQGVSHDITIYHSLSDTYLTQCALEVEVEVEKGNE